MARWLCHQCYEGWYLFEGKQGEGLEAILHLRGGVSPEEVENPRICYKGMAPALCRTHFFDG